MNIHEKFTLYLGTKSGIGHLTNIIIPNLKMSKLCLVLWVVEQNYYYKTGHVERVGE